MKTQGKEAPAVALIGSAVLLLVFLANVMLGAFAGSPAFGDVTEMLILFAASVCFVVAILRREADARTTNQEKSSTGRDT